MKHFGSMLFKEESGMSPRLHPAGWRLGSAMYRVRQVSNRSLNKSLNCQYGLGSANAGCLWIKSDMRV